MVTYSLNLVSSKVRDLVHEDEWQGAAKIDDFMQDERHDAGGENIVLHVCVPCRPSPLENVEVDVILRNVVEVVCVCHRRGDCRVPAAERSARRLGVGEGSVSYSILKGGFQAECAV